MSVFGLALLGVAACAGSSRPPQVPAAEPKSPVAAPVKRAPRAPVALEEYFKIRRVGSRGGVVMSFTHDEQAVAYLNDEGGRADIWVQSIAGGAPTQLTHANGFIHSFAFSPAADALVYEADTGGDELSHLYLTDSRGAAPRDLNGDLAAGRRAIFIEWADDGKTFLFSSSERDEKYLDLYEYDLAKDTATRLWESSGKLTFTKSSADHKRFVIVETISDADNNLYLLDRGSKAAPRLLTKHVGEILHRPQGFSKDAKTLYFTADADGEFSALYALDLAKQKSELLQRADWDLESAAFSEIFKYFFTSINVDGSNQLQLVETSTQKPIALPQPPPGGSWVPLTWSSKDRYLGVRLQSDGAPTAPYVVDLTNGTARQVIDPLPESLRARKMVVGRSVRVPSFDAIEVPAFLYRPEGTGPFPAIIDVHGGPTAQSKREFDRWRQYLVSKGYVVLVPNVRGSTGYGKTYTRRDNLDLGGGPLQDVVACKRWLVKEAHVDESRVVVLGGSYGGYMALAAATFTPKEFAASVDYFGVSDLRSLVLGIPPYWAAFATYIYKKFGDPNNPEHAAYQRDRSPANFVDRIERPLLVVQGDKDARVKKEQSDRIVAALQKRAVPVHYLVLSDEGHGFSKNENFLAAYKITDRFLDRYIHDDSTVVVQQ